MVTPFIFNDLGNRIADREGRARENPPFPWQICLLLRRGCRISRGRRAGGRGRGWRAGGSLNPLLQGRIGGRRPADGV